MRKNRYMLKDKTTNSKLPFKVRVSGLKQLGSGSQSQNTAKTPRSDATPTQVPPTRITAQQQPSPKADGAWHVNIGFFMFCCGRKWLHQLAAS